MAAPPTYTTEQRAHALTRLIANDGNVSATAAELGIRRETLMKWRDAVLPVVQRVSAPIADSADTLAEMVKAHLEEIAFGDPDDTLTMNDGAVQWRPWAEMSPRARRTLTFRTKLADTCKGAEREAYVARESRIPALALLAKVAGLIKPDTVNVDASQHLVLPADLSIDELRRLARGEN